jgi:hypothetical protein
MRVPERVAELRSDDRVQHHHVLRGDSMAVGIVEDFGEVGRAFHSGAPGDKVE